ncbi:hypothetical protein CR513_29128, partial [Mucuna pruriens]
MEWNKECQEAFEKINTRQTFDSLSDYAKRIHGRHFKITRKEQAIYYLSKSSRNVNRGIRH